MFVVKVLIDTTYNNSREEIWICVWVTKLIAAFKYILLTIFKQLYKFAQVELWLQKCLL